MEVLCRIHGVAPEVVVEVDGWGVINRVTTAGDRFYAFVVRLVQDIEDKCPRCRELRRLRFIRAA